MGLSSILKKLSTHIKVCFFLILILLFINLRSMLSTNQQLIEGYQNKSDKKIRYYYNFTIYDTFYIEIYDKLLHAIIGSLRNIFCIKYSFSVKKKTKT